MKKRERKKWNKIADFLETKEGLKILEDNKKINEKNLDKIKWIYLE